MISTVTSAYALSPQDRSSFDRNGFVKLRQVLDPDQLDLFAPVITDSVIDLNTQHLPLAERDTYGKAFLQVSNLWQHNDRVADFVRSPDLARLAAELLGVASVRLYHDQALYKEPGGGITPWHADQYYWPLSSDRCVTVWVPLQDTPADMGPLAFAAGSHRFEVGRDLPISDESEAELQRLLAEQDFPLDDAPYQLGDVSYHLGWTFHRAGPNSSSRPRRVMTVIYMDAEMRITEPVNEHQQTDIRTWMPGAAPGDPAATELNPVLYPPAG
ncbi:phytanoyl-CoA dioxygenase family protein [Microlunatus panaciterrae]